LLKFKKMSDENLENLRKKIDEIDEKILQFLQQRMRAVAEISRAKKNSGQKILDENREKKILEKLILKNENSFLSNKNLEIFWQQIFEFSRELQNKNLKK